MTGTIIIVALVAIGCIGLVGLFGDNLRGIFGASADAVAGNISTRSNDERSSTRRKNETLAPFGDNAGPGGGGGGGHLPPPPP